MSHDRDRYVPVGRGIWAPHVPVIEPRVGRSVEPAYGGRVTPEVRPRPVTPARRAKARFGNPGAEAVPSTGGPADMDGQVVWRPQELARAYGGAEERGVLSLPAGFRLGVWVDVGGGHLRRDLVAHADRLGALGFDDACVMINGHSHATFGYHATSLEVLRAFAPQLRTRGIALTLSSWLRPSRRFIDDMLASLPDLARELGAGGIEFDVEEPWTRSSSREGFGSHAEAADYLYDALDALAGEGISVGVTPQVDPMNHESLARLVQRAHLVVPQAYSALDQSWLRNDEARSTHAAHIRSHAVDGPYGPRGLQRRAAERLAEVRRESGPMPWILGLAAYHRDRWSDPREGGHASTEVMHMELERALELVPTHGVRGVRYWSWKWIAGEDAAGGGHADPHAASFIASLVRGSSASTAQSLV